MHFTRPKFINRNFCLQCHVLSDSNLKSFWKTGNCHKKLQRRNIQNRGGKCSDERWRANGRQNSWVVLSFPGANLTKLVPVPKHFLCSHRIWLCAFFLRVFVPWQPLNVLTVSSLICDVICASVLLSFSKPARPQALLLRRTVNGLTLSCCLWISPLSQIKLSFPVAYLLEKMFRVNWPLSLPRSLS